MNLKEKISHDKKIAMIEGETVKKLLLGTVLGEFERKSKESNRKTQELSDEEMIAILKKMKEGCKECGNDDEVKILDEYLPSLYTDDHLETIISDYILKEAIEHKKDTGKVMKWLKEIGRAHV